MTKLGLLAIILLALASEPAAAQAWKEYSYEEAGFAAQYQGQPKVEQRSYASAFANPIVERVYSHNEGGVDYIVAIADFTKANAEEDKTIDEAAKTLIARGQGHS